MLSYLHTNIPNKQAADSSVRVKGLFMGRHRAGVQGHSPGGAEKDLGSIAEGFSMQAE